MDFVTLDGGAGDNGLGLLLHGLFVENLATSDGKRRTLAAMSSTFGVVAPDVDVAVTLTFGDGRCRIDDGLGRATDAVIHVDSGRIPELSLLSSRCGLPWLYDEPGQRLVRALWQRQIRIDGLAPTSPRRTVRSVRAAVDLLRLTRILSVND
jgi:hypothetical protein